MKEELIRDSAPPVDEVQSGMPNRKLKSRYTDFI